MKNKIKIEEYQELSKRTLNLLDNKLNNEIHMSLGLTTESAEIADIYKKNIAYGVEIDYINLKEEIGDICFYIANLCNINGWDLRDILQTNIDKLQARYPEKFTTDKAINRDLETERKILEQ